MKIVGKALIVRERVISEKVTKNTRRTRVERHEEVALLLECGHAVALGRFGAAIPKHNTTCYCEDPRRAAGRAEDHRGWLRQRDAAAALHELENTKASFGTLAAMNWRLSEKVIPL
jgi:hypothetical protein